MSSRKIRIAMVMVSVLTQCVWAKWWDVLTGEYLSEVEQNWWDVRLDRCSKYYGETNCHCERAAGNDKICAKGHAWNTADMQIDSLAERFESKTIRLTTIIRELLKAAAAAPQISKKENSKKEPQKQQKISPKNKYNVIKMIVAPQMRFVGFYLKQKNELCAEISATALSQLDEVKEKERIKREQKSNRIELDDDTSWQSCLLSSQLNDLKDKVSQKKQLEQRIQSFTTFWGSESYDQYASEKQWFAQLNQVATHLAKWRGELLHILG